MKHRIALVIHALHGGGAERLMSQLASRWAPQHDVHLLTWSSEQSDQYRVDDQVQRHSLGLLRDSRHTLDAILSNFRRVRRLRSKLKELNPDLLLSFCDRTNIVALQASRRLRTAKWISEHSNPAQQRLGLLWETWRKRTYRHCDGCTVLTPDIAQWMSSLIAPERIRVIPPSISTPDATDAPEISPNGSNSAAATLQGNNDLGAEVRKRVLFVGRLSAEKRVDRLLSAWDRIEQKLPNWELVVVGSGPEEAELKAQAERSSRVLFPGWCPNPETYYKTADVFALPSDYEGFPVALLEAMSHGLASLATDCTQAFAQINHPDLCVSVVERDDGIALSEKLLELAMSDELRAKRSQLSRDRAREFYWENIGPKWDQIIETIAPRR